MRQNLQNIRHGYYELWFGTNAVYERWAKEQGLNNNLLLTLYLLNEYPSNCTQRLICEKLMLPKQTVNSILIGLETKGFVKKTVSPNDKRMKFLVFTASGKKYADTLLQKMNDFEERALLRMNSAQWKALLEGGFAFMDALRKTLDEQEDTNKL